MLNYHMSEEKIYIITRDIEDDDVCEESFWKELAIFSDLREAVNELNEIYNKTPDFKYYNYHIKVYYKINKKYIVSNEIHYHKLAYS
jgi:hypothetical protein